MGRTPRWVVFGTFRRLGFDIVVCRRNDGGWRESHQAKDARNESRKPSKLFIIIRYLPVVTPTVGLARPCLLVVCLSHAYDSRTPGGQRGHKLCPGRRRSTVGQDGQGLPGSSTDTTGSIQSVTIASARHTSPAQSRRREPAVLRPDTGRSRLFAASRIPQSL